MYRNRWLLIISSALLYSFPFIIPEYTHWLVFFFLVPLFIKMFTDQRLTFMEGLVWGLITFAITYYGLFYFIIEHGKTNFKWLAWLFLWLYVAVHAGGWFWLSSQLSSFFHKPLFTLFSFTVTTLFYFYWMTTSLLWIFGVREGTLFSFPLLPLAIYPRWLALLPVLDKYLLLLFFILMQGFLSLFLLYLNKRYLIVCFLFVLPYIYGWLLPLKKQEKPSWLSQIGFLNPPHFKYPYDCAENLMQQIQTLGENPTIQIIIGPESTFPFSLNTYKKCFALLTENGLVEQQLLFGAHRKEYNRLYNSLYWLGQGRIIQVYDKTHLTPFTEKTPNIWKKFELTKKLFLHKMETFWPGSPKNQLITIENNTFFPMICSELFFIEVCPPTDQKTILLVLVNDRWFSCAYLNRLMALVAHFKVLEWERRMLYVSHEMRLFFSSVLRYTYQNHNSWVER